MLMCRIPRTLEHPKGALNNHDVHSYLDTLHAMGNKHCQAFPAHIKKPKIPNRSSGIFYQMAEAEAVNNIREERIKKFIFQNIICCFGVPLQIKSGNGT